MLKLFDDEARSHSVTVTGSQGWKSRDWAELGSARPPLDRALVEALLVLGTFPSLLSESYLKAVVWFLSICPSWSGSKGSEVGDGDGG